ncbi:hypothetical protein NBO_923g0001 [Nosema bombycis CQ1]|uniref:Uncharacterized protein n=1 Tax=Nosema bombycis (strain CQ1 / CVCC 102059) TaxID=578461 RepID=R0MG33_NOSB1|nr:hypothetical protein NBO_923g0001 [Nosema bombycis CQ1]|eukprot:EOB11723.1 hypothetical protein NBO_923g0001 [Nosema bombycis CQ1]
MKILLIFLFYLLNTRGDIFSVKMVYLLETNFSYLNQCQIISNKNLFLSRVGIYVKGEKDKYVGFYYYKNNFHFNKSTNSIYAVLYDKISENIISFSKSKESKRSFLAIDLFFTDTLVNNYDQFEQTKKGGQTYLIYKLLEKTSENDISLNSNEFESRKIHVQERLRSFIYIKISNLMNISPS